MEFGVHLPLISFAGEQRSLDELLAFTEAARDLGYTHLCANDHLVFSRPWLMGTALAVCSRAGQRRSRRPRRTRLRGPAATAKILAAIDCCPAALGGRSRARLVCSRLRAGRGGDWRERWKRLDEAVQALRAYWRADDVAFEGAFYSIAGFTLPPDAGAAPRSTDLDRELGIAGGAETRRAPCRWLARLRLQHDPGTVRSGLARRPGRGGGPAGAMFPRFPNGIATMWCYVTEDRARADAVLTDVLAPMLNRPPGAAPRDPADRFGGGVRGEAAAIRPCGRATRTPLAARRRVR